MGIRLVTGSGTGMGAPEGAMIGLVIGSGGDNNEGGWDNDPV
jgi:hypothetical protein